MNEKRTLIIVKIGTDERPAAVEDIEDLEASLKSFSETLPVDFLVTPLELEFIVINPTDDINPARIF